MSGNRSETQSNTYVGELVGRTALVTGGSRGIGRAIALALGAAGARVAITYRRGVDEARTLVEQVSGLGSEAIAIQADLCVPTTPGRVAAECQAFGAVDILLHNAGVASRGLDVAETSTDEVERLLRINAMAPHELTRLLLPGLRAATRADIIFVSSAETVAMPPGGAPYNMGKAAMEALALTLGKEEVDSGIRVNVVAPGLVVTDMGLRLVEATTGREGTEGFRYPFGRPCVPEDVASVVRHLVSPGFGYVSGQRIGVDGGRPDFREVLASPLRQEGPR